MALSIYQRYFVYSAEEEELKTKIYGKNATFGTVVVNGTNKRYTSIVTDMSKAKPDAMKRPALLFENPNNYPKKIINFG